MFRYIYLRIHHKIYSLYNKFYFELDKQWKSLKEEILSKKSIEELKIFYEIIEVIH